MRRQAARIPRSAARRFANIFETTLTYRIQTIAIPKFDGGSMPQRTEAVAWI